MSSEVESPLHSLRFPGESDEYRRAREELLRAEIDLRRRVEAVAGLRRALPGGGPVPTDYVFEASGADTGDTRPVRLSQLFEKGKDSLFVYSHMFIPGKRGLPLEEGCPSCTSIIDGIDGTLPHLTRQINFAVVAKVPIEQFRAHGRSRGWRHARLLSSAHNTYNRDYHAEEPDGSQTPQATVFVRRGGEIHHFWSSELFHVAPDPAQDMRHVDFMWPLWSVLDHTPSGRGTDWRPELDYSRARGALSR